MKKINVFLASVVFAVFAWMSIPTGAQAWSFMPWDWGDDWGDGPGWGGPWGGGPWGGGPWGGGPWGYGPGYGYPYGGYGYPYGGWGGYPYGGGYGYPYGGYAYPYAQPAAPAQTTQPAN
ncbi:MAG: hypothetical protein HQL35_04410 [Alphaproteobacteria bacterium]|nr:hypothetical protein [Alphaproteobacteria bacterium]